MLKLHLKWYMTKSLSQSDFIPDDETTGKMQHGLVIFCLLFPSSQDTTKMIHPTMSSFDNPAMGFEAGVFTGVRLFFTGLDMRLVAAVL